MIRENNQLKTGLVFNWFSRYESEEDNNKPSTHFPKQITTQRTSLVFKAHAEKPVINELTIQLD